MFSIFWPFKLAKSIFFFLINMIVLASCILTITALFGKTNWVLDLTTHFRLQYLVIQVVGLVLSMIFLKLQKKSRVEVIGTLIFLLVFVGLNLAVIAPYYMPTVVQARSFQARSELSGSVKILHMNVFGLMNKRVEAVVQTIREKNPDMITLVEYTEPWQQGLEKSGVLKAYSYRVSGKAHMALYSKLPLTYTRLFYMPGSSETANAANIHARFRVGGKILNLLVAHPPLPLLDQNVRGQKQMFGYWMLNPRQFGENLIVVGDLNTTPWSTIFPKLLDKTGLRDSQRGFGIQPSWPAFFMPLGIPIDHVLISQNLAVIRRETGPFTGSDHLPLFVELGPVR